MLGVICNSTLELMWPFVNSKVSELSSAITVSKSNGQGHKDDGNIKRKRALKLLKSAVKQVCKVLDDELGSDDAGRSLNAYEMKADSSTEPPVDDNDDDGLEEEDDQSGFITKFLLKFIPDWVLAFLNKAYDVMGLEAIVTHPIFSQFFLPFFSHVILPMSLAGAVGFYAKKLLYEWRPDLPRYGLAIYTIPAYSSEPSGVGQGARIWFVGELPPDNAHPS